MLSLTLLAELPELGRLSRRKIAKLVGVAPIESRLGDAARAAVHPQRASRRARGVVHGHLVATRRNVVIRTFYLRLRAGGKPKKLALVACMRKLLTMLNMMVRTNTSWDVPELLVMA